VAGFTVPVVPAAPIEEPGVPLPTVELPIEEPVLPDIELLVLLAPPLEPSVLRSEPEPARSSAPLPVELEEPSVVPVPVVPDRLPPVLPAAPSAVVVPGIVPSAALPEGPPMLGGFTQGRVVVVPALGSGSSGVCAGAKPAAVANAQAVASSAKFFLLAFMCELLVR
jgi:hypothetical protein